MGYVSEGVRGPGQPGRRNPRSVTGLDTATAKRSKSKTGRDNTGERRASEAGLTGPAPRRGRGIHGDNYQEVVIWTRRKVSIGVVNLGQMTK